MEESCFHGNNHRIMDEEEESDIGSMSSLSCGDNEDSSNSVGCVDGDEMKDDATSLRSSMSSFPSSSSSSSFSINDQLEEEESFLGMASLMSVLPFKRGLSKHYDGRSQSFTSLSDVKCLEDLIKQERPYKKKLKSSKSHAGGLDGFNPLSPKASSGGITKKYSKTNSFSSLNSRRHNFLSSKPPLVPSPRSSNLSGQTFLIA